MKTIILVFALLIGFTSWAAPTGLASAKTYSFQFKASKNKKFAITQAAPTQEEAYKLAARECFKKLTAGQYPGETRGLEIIDICANPKM